MSLLNIKIVSLLALTIWCLLFFGASVSAIAEGEWLDDGDINIYDSGQIDNDPVVFKSTNYGECYETKFTVVNFVKLGLFGGRYQEQDTDVCAYRVTGGFIGDKYFKKDGIKIAGRIQTTSGNKRITTLPNGRLLEFTQTANNYKVRQKIGAFNNTKIIGNYGTDSFAFLLDTSDAEYINGDDGKPLIIAPIGVSYSKNARYMAAKSTSNGMVMVDLIKSKVTTIDEYSDYNDVSLETSVSEDGRYMAVASTNSNYFKLYDAYNCKGNKCGYLNIHEKLKEKVPGYINGALNIRFNGKTIWFTAIKDEGGIKQKYKYAAAPPNTDIDSSKLDYFALGDSFSSGEGVHNYLPHTDTADNKCHLSVYSYPYLIAHSALGAGDFRSVACSGAKIKDVIYYDLEEYNKKHSQATGMESAIYDEKIYNNYLPGYRNQILFLEKNKPKIVTMSMGGNDIGFSKIIKKCVTSPNTCYESNSYERYSLASIINNKYDQLVYTYKSIKDNMADNGRLYIVGYPQVIDPGGNCAANVNMNSQEALFSSQLISYLNSRIEMAAKQAGVYFVSTEDAFNGHKLCETESWNVAFNGLTAGDDSPLPGWFEDLIGTNGPLAQESYHPNRLGHELFSKAVLGQTNNLTKEMPQPKASDPNIKDSFYNDFVGETKWPEKAIIHYDESVSADVIFKNAGLDYDIDNQVFSLKPDSEYTFSYYSEEVIAGTAKSDSDGNLSGTMPIPDVLPSGYHTLSIKGVNIVGEDIDIQKLVYVAETPEDIDGDGVPNSEEKCLAVEPANQDIDQDGIDDACDGFIDEPPAPTDEPDDVGVVDNPDITNTTKNLPESENRPQWLLDLEAEIQARNALQAQQGQQNNTDQPTASNNGSQPALSPNQATNNQQAQIDEQNTPQTSSATDVRGIEDIKLADEEPVAYQQAIPLSWIIALPITIALLFISYIIYRRYATQEL